MQKAIQFIGTQRSGSNLLRVMLHQHPEICAPHPPHILQILMPFLPMYGDLNADENFKRLIHDACTLVELNPVQWHLKFDRQVIFERCTNRSLSQILKSIYEIKAEAKNASIWCCKSMASIHYIREMEVAEIHPFYIYIFRDGRDVALSFLKAIVGEKHIYHLAKQWKDEQDLSISLCEKVGPDRCILIRYEELIENPEPILKSICEKIGIVFNPSMLNYTDSEESKETAASGKMWANLVKPVMKNNTKKFISGLSAYQIKLFEEVAGDTLEKLGFVREFVGPNKRIFTETEIALFNESNAKAKSESKANAIPGDIEKRVAQDKFILELKNRHTTFLTNL